jgi:dipeptidyl aminopeptidase/acylaminoacyl peptidase
MHRGITSAAAVVALAAPATAGAAYPGQNGDIYSAVVFGGIYATQPDGEVRRVTETPRYVLALGSVATIRGDSTPASTPDGRTLVFTSDRESAEAAAQVYAVAPDGTGLRRLTLDAAYASTPRVAAGDRVLYTRGRGPEGLAASELAVVPLAGGVPAAVPGTDGAALGDVSPDGRRAVFFQQQALWTAAVDGSDRQRIADVGRRFDGASWSPDGRTIAFSNGVDTFVVPAAGGSAPRRFAAGSTPAWSPDGTLLGVDDPELGFVVRRPDGSGARELRAGYEPYWAPAS